MQISPQTNQIIKTGGLIVSELVVLVAGVLLYAYFGVLKPYTAALERPRVPLLKKIAAAQVQFRAKDLDKDGIQDYGTLKELIKAKLLTQREVSKGGFVFCEPATSDPKNRWRAVAQTLHPMQGRAFFLNQNGTVYFADDELYLKARVNRKTGEIPTKTQTMSQP